jgi:glutaminase
VPTPVNSQHVDERLEELYRRHLLVGEDSVANYYESGRGYYKPELAAEEHQRFSICLVRTNGEVHQAGDHDRPFALQSISKVFVYGLALADHGGDYVLEHVGVEPSGDAFNSIIFDERNNRPYNPMVNAGALVTTDLVRGKDSAEKFERILGTLRSYAGNQSLGVDEDTFEAEMRTADRNRATGYLMRSNGMLSGDVEEILALYLRQCSVQVTCRDLAVMAATLATAA